MKKTVLERMLKKTETRVKVKKTLKEISLYIFTTIKWLLFGNAAIYVATRLINFVTDPYMEDWTVNGYYKDEILTMFIQTILFMVIFGMIVSLYKLLFKKSYTWQTVFTFIVTAIILLFGIFN